MNKKFLLLFLLTPLVFAADYYADVSIVVDNNGLVSISGLTNHPILNTVESSDFTTFGNNYWLLNITLLDVFSNYVYEITLPEGAVINYINTPDIMSISHDNGNMIITAIGNDEPFKAVVQYSVRQSFNYFQLLWFLVIPLAVIAYFYLKKSKKRAKKIDYFLLTERQASIMRIVEKKKKVTQKQLENILNLPKSALSRNIESLIRKDLIVKERKGLTNVIMVKK
ncbi:MAG: hypothetical protein JW791_00420 [Nanoarchaeota archaeon]|nr:hypothetical protein [Nanoarchaeota archaeon]